MNTSDSKSSTHMDVRFVANLARIHLSDEEVALYESQLDTVLKYVNKLNELNIDGIEPLAHAQFVQNIFRADERCPCLDHDLVMQNAPATFGDEIRVPKIVD